ncbi:hypothetical protein REIFOR_00904 [Reinekea forsetii]|jgi:hypothetical protein|uniref:Uncharacterized protein n=1 Tax=Reinekea forsetii TaxID=1336806 RepID=A0A2K8KN06_9GAMM|nr:hypothetical protein REIFOR_00904 [Reinekea forsetii]
MLLNQPPLWANGALRRNKLVDVGPFFGHRVTESLALVAPGHAGLQANYYYNP